MAAGPGEPALRLIVGLGNPGARYEGTRHNAGFWFVEALARQVGALWRREARFHGEVARAQVAGRDCWLLRPLTYMNRSGLAVAAAARYWRLPPEAVLVVHDELDLPPGVARLKRGGGHAGHNGLRSIQQELGEAGFLRLRLGIGHPGSRELVTPYVLGRPPAEEESQIREAVARALEVLPELMAGDLQRAMHRLHTR